MLARCILLLGLVLAATGCDQVNQIIGPPRPAEETHESRMRALQAPVSVPKAPPPPPPTVEEIVAAFEGTPPGNRTDGQLAKLSEFPTALSGFEELDLSNSTVTDLGGQRLEGFTNLRSLVLTNTRITDRTIQAVSTLTRLERLDLSGTQVTDAAISSLTLLKNLRELRLDKVNLSDSGFARLGELPFLEAVSARGCRGISGQQFTTAIMQGAYPALRVLKVARTRFGIAGLTRIGMLQGLEHLDVTSCGVTDDGLKGIGACRRLVILEAGLNNFGPIGCAALASCGNLRELAVDTNASVKDECFNSLKSLRNLEKLDVSRTSVTEEAVRLLKSRFLPRVVIQYNDKIL